MSFRGRVPAPLKDPNSCGPNGIWGLLILWEPTEGFCCRIFQKVGVPNVSETVLMGCSCFGRNAMEFMS